MRKNTWLLLSLCMGAALVLSGCKSKTPAEDLRPVEEASPDPSDMSGRSSDLDSTNGRGFGPGGEGQWVNNRDGRLGGADADGWTLADPSGNRLVISSVYPATITTSLSRSSSIRFSSVATASAP